MRHPEIEPTLDAKPTWKEIVIGIMSFLALAGLIAWNKLETDNTASSTRFTQQTLAE
jgi:hypothetical protein